MSRGVKDTRPCTVHATAYRLPLSHSLSPSNENPSEGRGLTTHIFQVGKQLSEVNPFERVWNTLCRTPQICSN